jgi:catechol 2,3-dioxygenase
MSAALSLEAFNAPAHIAGISLHVRDIEAVSAFYRDVIGLAPTLHGDHATLAAADGTALVRLVANPALAPASADAPGLFHTAFVLPTRADLANWLAHAQALGLRLEGASDHLVSEAIYLSDPEGNGIEVYVDRPRADWPRDAGMIRMATLPLDGASLMAERDSHAGAWHFPAMGRIGHVHLKVADLALAEAFYRDRLGLEVMARYPGATFMGWGGYHHHIAVNVWQSKGAATRPELTSGLGAVMIAATVPPAWSGATDLTDPSGNHISLG